MNNYNILTSSSLHGNVVDEEGSGDDTNYPGCDNEAPTYFPFWVTVAFTLNYILGSGFLTLPWGFQQTGLLLGVLVLLIFAFFSVLSTIFILETTERANIINKVNFTKLSDKALEMATMDSKGTMHDTAHSYQSIESLMETTRRASIDTIANQRRIHNGVEEFENGHDGKLYARKLEITELCNLFLGDRGRKAYSLTIIVYIYGTLWAYSTVFANAFASHLNIGEHSYLFYLLLFACIVIPFSLREFSEQVTVQVVLSVFRMVMVSAMVVTTVVAFWNGHNEFGEDTESIPSSDPFKVSFDGLHLLMPVAAYSYIFHHSIPSLSHNVRDKSTLTSLYQTALIISMIAYIGVGAIVSLYFGNSTKSSSNLNWTRYLALIGNNGGEPSLFAHILSFFVVLFPAIDVASAYPLNAYTLGNNMMSAYYGKDTHKHEHHKWQLRLFRLLAATPPLFGAMIDADLGRITDFTGLTAFGLVFVFPPLLAYTSANHLEEMHVDPQTIHSSWWTSFPFQLFLGGSGLVLLLYVSACLLIY